MVSFVFLCVLTKVELKTTVRFDLFLSLHDSPNSVDVTKGGVHNKTVKIIVKIVKIVIASFHYSWLRIQPLNKTLHVKVQNDWQFT